MKIKIEDVNFEQDAKIKPGEIEELRTSVGWDNDAGPYSKILPNVYTYFTARYDQLLIGFVSVLSDQVSDAYIQDLVVRKNCQKNGVGSSLLKRAILFMQKKKIKCIQLTFHPRLEKFYKKFGFHILRAGIIDRDAMDVKIEL